MYTTKFLLAFVITGIVSFAFAQNGQNSLDPYYDRDGIPKSAAAKFIVGGSVINTRLKTVVCTNATTGKSITINGKGAMSWSCAGLQAKVGDTVWEILGGTVIANTSCKNIVAVNPIATSGIYTIDPDGPSGNAPFAVYCDMETDGGGWTLVQKTDGSSTTDKTVDAVNTSELLSPAIDTVAKFSDVVINAIQGGTSAETRVESPTFTAKLFVTGTKWSIVKYSGYPTVIQARTSGNTYGLGGQCYDSDGACGTDHYCFGKLPPTTDWGEHVCIRRLDTAGIWFNGGSFNGSYQPGRVWIR